MALSYCFCFREIVTNDVTEGKPWFFFSTHTFKYQLIGINITCIFVTNMISYKVPFYVTQTDGGIGKYFIVLKLKSGWQSPLHARIMLYGYTTTHIISGPTQPILRRISLKYKQKNK